MTRLHSIRPLAALALLALFASNGFAADTTPWRSPRPVSRTLANGLRVSVLPSPGSGLAQIHLRANAGLDREPAGQSGVANLTAQLLLAGTTHRDAERIGMAARHLGLSLRAAASRDHATLQTVCLPGDLDVALELLADIATRPAFPDREFQSAVAAITRLLLQSHGSPGSVADEQIAPWALPSDPAASPSLGTVPSVLQLTRDQVRAFHAAAWTPQGAELLITGAVDPERGFSVAEEWFGAWRGGSAAAPAAPADSARPALRVRLVDLRGARTAEVRLAWVSPGRTSEDETLRSFAARLLESRLAARFGDAKVGHDARVTLNSWRNRGLWVVSASAPPESAGVLVARLRAVVTRFLASPATAAELASTRRAVRGAYPFQFETLAGLAQQWSLAGLYGFPPDYFDRYVERIDAATPDAIAKAAGQGTRAPGLAILVAGPADAIRKRLASLGPIDEIVLDKERAPSAASTESAPPASAAEIAEGRRLLEAAIQAHGGLEAFRKVKDSVVDADLTLTIDQNRLEGSLRVIRREPSQMSYLTEINDFRSKQVLNGSDGWTEIESTAQIQNADSSAIAAMRAGFRSDIVHLLTDALEPGVRAAARGAGKFGDADALRVELSGGGLGLRTLWLDAKSNRVIALDTTEQVVRAGAVPARRIYRDCRLVNGIQWPFSEERLLDGKPLMLIQARSVTINLGISEAQFQRPKSVAAPRGK